MENTILITGGAGFICNHLVDRLVDSNNIIVYDNRTSGNLSNYPVIFLGNLAIYRISKYSKIAKKCYSIISN